MSRDLVNGIPYAYKSDSSRHDACIPMEKRQAAAAAMAAMKQPGDTRKGITSWDELRNDFVTRDRLYVNRVDKETEAARTWKTQWSFLSDLDPKGNPVQHEELPEHISCYSQDVPNTNAGNYGSRVETETGRELNNLEFRLIGSRGKRKIDQDISCNY